MFIKFASGTIKQPFGADLMKNSGSSSNQFRPVVIVLNMKAMGGLRKLAALAIVIKVHKRHNKTTIWCQFDENYQNQPVAQENKL